MSEQAQATHTIRAEPVEGDRSAIDLDASAGADRTDLRPTEEASDDTLSQESARLREKADARLATEREAEEREAAEQEAYRVRELLADYQARMSTASARLDHAAAAIADISATLMWEPTRLAEVDLAIDRTLRGLTDFRAHLASAASLGAEQHLRAPDPDLGRCFVDTLDASRELHRRIGAQIAVMETDIGNTPALRALERSIIEQALLCTAMGRGLGRLLVEMGIAR